MFKSKKYRLYRLIGLDNYCVYCYYIIHVVICKKHYNSDIQMCGILFYLHSKLEGEKLDKLDKLNNRGPDNTNHVSYNRGMNAYFSRLAIIKSGAENGQINKWQTNISDDTQGLQPLKYQSLKKTNRAPSAVAMAWHVLCNGEIFNYKDIAIQSKIDKRELRTDIDILLHLVKQNPNEPDQWLSRLNGDFSGILFNPETGQIILFRDTVGVRPLYIGYSANGEFIGAGSLKSAAMLVPGVVKISEFPPGYYMTVLVADDNSIDMCTEPINYMCLDARPLLGHTMLTNYELCKQGIYTHLQTAIRQRLLHSDVPVGFLCSGGLDSSIILTLGHQIWTNELNLPAERLEVFSIEFEGDGQSSDAFYAKMLTAKLGVKHTIFKFSKSDIAENLDDIIRTVETDDYKSLRAAIPQYFLAKQIRETTLIRVIFSGEGADELFLGYNYQNLCPSPTDAVNESCRLIRNIHRYDVLRADRTISNWGLEIRVPFLDSWFIRFVHSIDGKLRNTNVEKQILRDTFRDYSVLAELRILDRMKEKFSDGCGLGYIPALMRIIAVKSGVDSTQSAHLLEIYEKNYVKQEYMRIYAGIEIESNVEFRELPVWASKDTDNKPIEHGLLLG